MDHGDNDKRFHVYVHKDKDGNVRYVGQGAAKRYKAKAGRSKEHLAAWDTLDKIILYDNLTKDEANDIEDDLIVQYTPSGLLFNKAKGSHRIKPIYYREVSKYLEYDETSPTFLRWKVGRGNKTAGKPAGSLQLTGYISVASFAARGHRIVWVLCTKEDLVDNMVIDHIDGNRANNNINNLRKVTSSENNKNRDVVRNAKTVWSYVTWRVADDAYLYIYRVKLSDGNVKQKSKSFHPKRMYPDLPESVAKQKALDDARKFKQEVESDAEHSFRLLT